MAFLVPRCPVGWLYALLTLLALIGPVDRGNARELKIEGVPAVIAAVVEQHKGAIEAESGQTCSTRVVSTGRALVDLASNTCDIIAVAETLDVAVNAAEYAGVRLDAFDFRFFPVGSERVVFVVNVSNPIERLSRSQSEKAFHSRAANWREFGGAECIVSVVMTAPSSAVSALVRRELLNGREFCPDYIVVPTAERALQQVAQLPGAITAVPARAAPSQGFKILKSPELRCPWGLVVRRDADSDTLRFVSTVRAQCGFSR